MLLLSETKTSDIYKPLTRPTSIPTFHMGAPSLQGETFNVHIIMLVFFFQINSKIVALNIVISCTNNYNLLITLLFCSLQGPLVYIDSFFYGKTVIAPLGIVLYNVFGKGGPSLYGKAKTRF